MSTAPAPAPPARARHARHSGHAGQEAAACAPAQPSSPGSASTVARHVPAWLNAPTAPTARQARYVPSGLAVASTCVSAQRFVEVVVTGLRRVKRSSCDVRGVMLPLEVSRLG